MQFRLSKSAAKYLKSTQPRIAAKLVDAIERLPNGDVKSLKGKKLPPLFRLRLGKYRIIFKRGDKIIQVIKIDTRGDVYKNL